MSASSLLRRASRSITAENSSSETTPLLAAAAVEGDLTQENSKNAELNKPQEPLPQDSRQRRVTVLLALLTLSIVISQALVTTAETSIFETIYCRQYYHEHAGLGPIQANRYPLHDDVLCKTREVQRLVSSLRGGQQFFTNLPALLMAFPVGLLADRHGRKWLLSINMVSLVMRMIWACVVCSFPDVLSLKLVWLEAVFAMFGGGLMVSAALIFTILTDVTQEAQRASTFFLIGASDQLGSVLGTFLSAAVMQRGAWTTFYVGVILQTFAIPIVLCIPETLPSKAVYTFEDRSNADHEEGDMPIPAKSRVAEFARSVMQSLTVSTRFLFTDWRVALMASFYPFRMFANSLDTQLLQYIPRRYGLSMASAALCQSVQAIFCGLALLVILPMVSSYTLRYVSPTQKDVLFARVGFGSQALGWLAIGLAPHIGLLLAGLGVGALAAGTGSAIRAAVTSWVQAQEIARLNGVLGVLECLGLVVAGPVVAGLYNAGISILDGGQNSSDILAAAVAGGAGDGMALGGMKMVALGLPWLISAGLTFLVMVVIWSVNWQYTDAVSTEASSSDNEISGSTVHSDSRALR